MEDHKSNSLWKMQNVNYKLLWESLTAGVYSTEASGNSQGNFPDKVRIQCFSLKYSLKLQERRFLA